MPADRPARQLSPAHREAKVWAYQLIEQAQVEPGHAEVDALLETAASHDWADVEFLAHYARMVAAHDDERDFSEHADRMAATAERSGNDALLSCALAVRATVPPHTHPDRAASPSTATTGRPVAHPRNSLEVERGLARAVALLNEGGGDPVDRPTAYIACGLAHYVRGRWELALELYHQALAALELPIEPGMRQIFELSRRVTRINMLEAVAPLACSLAEVGLRDEARAIAAGRIRLTAQELASMPPSWADEALAEEFLLSALAQEETPLRAEELLARLHPTLRPRYRASVHLGLAVRAADAEADAEAATHAEISLLHRDTEFLAGVQPYALALTTLGSTPAHAWQRYAHTVSSLRWQAHLADVDAARAQIQLAMVVLENHRLSQRAYLDELTGLANRHAYARYLARLRHEGPGVQVAVFMVDVDRFKVVNDAYGHETGDRVLRRIAGLLVDMTRPSDLAVRLGGDEFVVLLAGGSLLEMPRRGQELVEAVAAEDWENLGPGLSITISVGLASGPCRDVDQLLQSADEHLYAAKSAGRGRIVHADPAGYLP